MTVFQYNKCSFQNNAVIFNIVLVIFKITVIMLQLFLKSHFLYYYNNITLRFTVKPLITAVM